MESLCLLEDFCKLDRVVVTHVSPMVEASSFAGVETHRSTCEA